MAMFFLLCASLSPSLLFAASLDMNNCHMSIEHTENAGHSQGHCMNHHDTTNIIRVSEVEKKEIELILQKGVRYQDSAIRQHVLYFFQDTVLLGMIRQKHRDRRLVTVLRI